MVPPWAPSFFARRGDAHQLRPSEARPPRHRSCHLIATAQFPAQGVRVDVVDERALPVHLDHGQPFAVARLELRVASDVDLLELEGELVADGPDDGTRALAEVAPGGVVNDDAFRYG